jgi:methionyl-tRNA formyltransferase
MKIVFFGTPDFSLKALEMLHEHHEVAMVVTQPDKRKGRGKKIQMTPVKEYAIKMGIPVFQPENINESYAIDLIREKDPDAAVVVAYGQILKDDMLNLPRLGCYNIHASLLPAYRGAAPIHRAIINGEEKTGITIMKMDKGMDTGDMIIIRELPIKKDDTVGCLHDRLAVLGAEAILEAIAQVEKGTAIRTVQDNALATYAPKLTKETGAIDWSKSSEEILNLIRGLNPWPVAYTYYQNIKMKILEAKHIECESDMLPGTYIRMCNNGFLVKTGSDCLLITRVQFPNKKAMYADEYARGHILETGTIFGK